MNLTALPDDPTLTADGDLPRAPGVSWSANNIRVTSSGATRVTSSGATRITSNVTVNTVYPLLLTALPDDMLLTAAETSLALTALPDDLSLTSE